jgi:hypothetical protein
MTAPDPLLRTSVLDYELRLPVLGIETRFDSNSEDVIELVEQSFGRWRHLSEAERTAATAARVRVIVNDGDEGIVGRSPISHTSGPGKGLLVQSQGSIGYVDPLRQESVAYVTSQLVEDRDHFRVAVLEAITFALLACFDRHPLHASAIAGGGRTALLAGLGGSGKSTLAYLAHSAGIDVLSDDHVWLQLEPDCRIWGSAPHARLGADAAAHFPEVEHAGGEKVAIHLSPRDDDHRLVARGPVVCILARGDRASLVRLEPSDIQAELASQLSAGFDRFPERNGAAFASIAEGGGWRLTLSDNPRDALPLLHQVLDGS